MKTETFDFVVQYRKPGSSKWYEYIPDTSLEAARGRMGVAKRMWAGREMRLVRRTNTYTVVSTDEVIE